MKGPYLCTEKFVFESKFIAGVIKKDDLPQRLSHGGAWITQEQLQLALQHLSSGKPVTQADINDAIASLYIGQTIPKIES